MSIEAGMVREGRSDCRHGIRRIHGRRAGRWGIGIGGNTKWVSVAKEEVLDALYELGLARLRLYQNLGGYSQSRGVCMDGR